MLHHISVKLIRYPVETSTPAQTSSHLWVLWGDRIWIKVALNEPIKGEDRRHDHDSTDYPLSPDHGIILVPRVRVRQWRDAWKHRDTIYLPPVAARSESNERQNASIYPRSSRISAVQSPPPRTKGAQPACERVRLTNDPTRPRARSITRLV